jgi:hypothetical protein
MGNTVSLDQPLPTGLLFISLFLCQSFGKSVNLDRFDSFLNLVNSDNV